MPGTPPLPFCAAKGATARREANNTAIENDRFMILYNATIGTSVNKGIQ